jgi:glutathione S-transferase
MRLIGMLDSPYVRRVAISLKLLGIPFSHDQVSVFRHFDEFSAINPVVKAPTLITNDKVTLMDSSLILDYIDRLVAPERRLTPIDLAACARSLRLVGLALAACDKTVQIEYELKLRPAEKWHQPWLDRVRGQLLAAYGLLEADVGLKQGFLFGERPLQADISVAVAWRFTQYIVADVVAASAYPALAAFSERLEALPEFLSTPLE